MGINLKIRSRALVLIASMMALCSIQTVHAAGTPGVLSSKPKKTEKNAAAEMISIKAVDAVHYGKKNIRLCFLMTNNGTQTVIARLHYVGAMFSGSKNALFTKAIHMSGDALFTVKDNIDQRIPAGASVKGYAYFENMADTVSVVDAVGVYAFFTLSNDGGFSFHFDPINEKDECRASRGCQVRPYPESNVEKCVCTYPDFALNVKSLYRYGTNVVLTFSLKNGNVPTTFNFGAWKAYDSDGTMYNAPMYDKMTFNNKKIYTTSKVKMVSDAEATFQLTIQNFPAGTNTLQMLRLPLEIMGFKRGIYDNSTDTEITFRNLEVKPAPAATAKPRTSAPVKRKPAVRRR